MEEFDNCGCQIVVYRSKMLPRGEWLDLPEDPIYVEDIVRLHHDVKKQAKKEACIANLIQEDVVEVSSSNILFDDYILFTLWQENEKDGNKEDDENEEVDDEVNDDNEEEKTNGCTINDELKEACIAKLIEQCAVVDRKSRQRIT